MTRHAIRLSALVSLSLCLVMCGGAPSRPADSPTQYGYPAPASYPQQAPAGPATQGAQPGAAPPPPAPAAAAPAGDTGDTSDTPRRREAARAELSRAQVELEAAASDCAAACRALSSMERATTHLCDLSGAPDDQSRCDDARQRLLAARERVRSACGGCR